MPIDEQSAACMTKLGHPNHPKGHQRTSPMTYRLSTWFNLYSKYVRIPRSPGSVLPACSSTAKDEFVNKPVSLVWEKSRMKEGKSHGELQETTKRIRSVPYVPKMFHRVYLLLSSHPRKFFIESVILRGVSYMNPWKRTSWQHHQTPVDLSAPQPCTPLSICFSSCFQPDLFL